MILRRKLLLALGATPLAAALPSFAQQAGKVWRIGFLGTTSAEGYASQVEALRTGLRERSYVEGKNLAIEFRWADQDYARLPQLAKDLVGAKVDVIVTHGTPGTRAAKAATTTIPIVVATMTDPVAQGLVASLARPGGNLTGLTNMSVDEVAKRLELIKDAFPRARRVAVLHNPDNPSVKLARSHIDASAAALKLEVRHFDVQGSAGIDGVFAAMAKARVDAAVLGDDSLFTLHAAALARLAAGSRLPAVGAIPYAEAGGLMAYAADRLENYRRVGLFVDRIVKGSRAGDIPMEQPTKFELVVNMKAAKAQGIQLSQSILFRATRVIE